MRQILTFIALLIFLIPSVALGEEVKVEDEELRCKGKDGSAYITLRSTCEEGDTPEPIENVGLTKSITLPIFYSVKTGRFFTDEGEVPLGCLAELMIELNGDDVVAAVYLNRTVFRGCIDSNRHSVDENIKYGLAIKKVKSNDVFWIRICESVSGSMGQTCGKLIIQFVKRSYLTPEGNKDVVSIEKLGKW